MPSTSVYLIEDLIKENCPMLEFIVIRHGETAWNAEKIFRGRTEIQLDETGRRQASLLADYLKDEKLEAVYTSPLERAKETAARIAELQKLEVIPVNNLADMDFGQWQGKKITEVEEADPELFKDWLDTPEQIAIPGGESLGQVTSRVVPFLEDLGARHTEGKIVIVTHRVLVKLIICWLLEVPNNKFWNFQVDTGSQTRFRIQGTRAVLVTANDTSCLRQLKENREDF